MSAPSYDHLKTIKVTFEDNVALMQFTRPKEMNSFISEQYHELGYAVNTLAKDDRCIVAVLTGAGPYFSSGHDLKSFSKGPPEGEDFAEHLAKRTDQEANLIVKALIEFPKPFIMAINGPCVGISATITQIADITYCSDTATFHTPFMQLGFCAEGCSSLLFPEVMGPSKANEMLLLGRKLSAQEAEKTGFVAAVFPVDQMLSEVMVRAKQMAAYPPNALKCTKGLVRDNKKKLLHQVNKTELTALVERFASDECAEAVMNFMMQQQAKKKKDKKSKL